VEGDTDNEAVLALRQRQMRNYHLALMLSQGTPMLLIGGSCGAARMPSCPQLSARLIAWQSVVAASHMWLGLHTQSAQGLSAHFPGGCCAATMLVSPASLSWC
jgi:hypothetical protein